MFTTVAYYASLSPAGLDVKVAPVADVSVRISGNDLYVPALNQLLAVAGMVSTTVATAIARLTAPSLLRVSRQVAAPIQGAAAAINLPGDPHAIALFTGGLADLATNEALDAIVNSTPAAAQIHSVVVWLADSSPSPVLPAEIFTIRATGATALVAGTWTPVSVLTFDDQLPVGRYSIVGMRAQSPNLIAARLVVPGYAWRPGVLGCNSPSHRDDWRFRQGRVGEYAQFDEVTLFSVECLAGAADAAEQFHFDVAKIG